jgi:hydroxymethylpyrimidine/phosphomethylpyrimidine kinase
LNDLHPDTVKVGMLCNAEITHAVAESLRRYASSRPLVLIVDPVMYSKSGGVLLEEKAHGTLIKEILPLATLVTPNLAEAFELSDIEADSLGTMHEAAERIFALGPKNVLIKGGHLQQDAVDVLYDGSQFSEFFAPRIQTPHTHGTGCLYSAAIATFMAFGDDLPTAVAAAKEFVSDAIEAAFAVGAGIGPVNPYGALLTAEGDPSQV